MQKLELQLGSCLLDRLPVGVALTDVGARLVTHAEDVLAAEDRLRSISCGKDAQPAGTVQLMAPESLCAYRLPEVVGAVRRTAPEVQLSVTPGGIDDALDSVRRGTVDLALTMEPRVPITDMAMELIGTETLAILGHGPANSGTRSPATWAQLAGCDALLIERGCGYSDDVADRLTATRRHGRRSRFGSVEAIKRCVEVGLGWTVLPKLAVETELRTGSMTVIDGPQLPDCEIHIITHPRRHRGPAVGIVLTELREAWQVTVPSSP